MRRLYIETMEEILRRNPTVIVDDRLQGLVPFLNLGDRPRAPAAGAAPGRAAAAGPPPAVPQPPAGSAAMNRLDHRRRACSAAARPGRRVIAVHRAPDPAGADHPVRPADPRDHRARACTAKMPFIQTVITFDRRLLDFDAPGEEVILGDQRRLIVDSFTRYRITDPLRFYQTVGRDRGRHPRRG